VKTAARALLALCLLQSTAVQAQDASLTQVPSPPQAPLLAQPVSLPADVSLAQHTTLQAHDAALLAAAAHETTNDNRTNNNKVFEPCMVGDCGACGDCQNCCCFYPGWFAGVGGSYNSVRVDSVVSGSGVTDIFDSSGDLVAVGFAGGPAAPFRSTETTFAPVVQLGYFQNFGASEWLWGTKFSYKYLGLTHSYNAFDAPQVGVYEVLDPPSTSTFTGNAFTNSAQTLVNHELALLPFIGHSFRNGRVYFGGGPVAFETQTKMYGLYSFADINGVHTNVGGAPVNLHSSQWLWGGAFQMGVVYYLRPWCFFDFSYDFMVTGIHKTDWPTPVSNESNGLTYVTDIIYRNELRVWAQSFNVTFNVKF
jgi:hypothetical protein